MEGERILMIAALVVSLIIYLELRARNISN